MDNLTHGEPARGADSAYTLSGDAGLERVSAFYEPALRMMEIDEAAFLIPGELPTGYTIVMGAPKTGKTALLLPVAQRLAREGRRVLYVVLDDSVRRMRDRDIAAAPDETFPTLCFIFGWQPRDRLAAFGQLELWLTEARAHGEAYDAVIVDTYGRFVGRRPAGDVFGYDYETGQAFKSLCERQGTSVIVTHHTRKGRVDGDWLDQVSGSAGMTASCDAIWYIERTRNSREGVLCMTGNDLEEAVRPLTLGSDMVWRPSQTTTVAQAMHTGTPRAVLDYLMDHTAAPLKEIQDAVGETYNTVRCALGRLHGAGLVDTNGESWSLTDHPDNSLPTPFAQTPAPAARTAAGTGPQAAPADAQSVGAQATGLPQEPPSAAAPAAPAAAARSILPELTLDTCEVPDDAELNAAETPRERSELLKRGAIKASMKLMKASVQRDTARYHPSLFAAQPPIEKQEIWEGRNRWQLPAPAGATVLQLDRGAAFLSAANTALPIGPLTRDDDPAQAFTGGQTRAGYHRVSVPEFDYPCGGPFHTRTDRDSVWITTPTLKQLIDLRTGAPHQWPQITLHESWTAPATEVLLRPWITVLRDTRARALAAGDAVLYQYVKNCYSLVVSTMGESGANWEIRRPDWMHIIRAQAYANLWRKAVQAVRAGVGVVKVGNTDELWIIDGHEEIGRLFPVGNGLGQWKVKGGFIAQDGESA